MCDFLPRIESDGSLFVYNVTQDDAGMYECSAQNNVGYATAQARVIVTGKLCLCLFCRCDILSNIFMKLM